MLFTVNFLANLHIKILNSQTTIVNVMTKPECFETFFYSRFE